MKKVLITGATGATGANAIKKLLELKVPVRALVHKVDERSEKLSSQGKIYPLYGPKELTQFEVADILTQVLGRKIT
jgi:NAD(P)H dehydrogenase (quinone)